MQASKRTLFGTDGIRGLTNTDPMTPEMALRLGRAIAYVFCRPGHRGRVVIGKDTRLSGYLFEQALSAGLCSMGADVQMCGPLPTPGVAFLTSSMRADAGIIISASHNPFPDNGIKIFASDGFKLPDAVELRIEELMASTEMDSHRPSPTEVGKTMRLEDARGRYVVSLKHTFPGHLSLEGTRVVIDCAHGAGYKVGPMALHELGATVHVLNNMPNGKNINEQCGALHPQALAQAVREKNAHLGIALDGDADRLVLVDEKGQVVHGDAVLALCAQRLLRKQALRRNTLVATVMSNLGLERSLQHMGASLLRTPVGDRYVVEAMREQGFSLGGEQSGHLIFLDHATTGDGMIAALQVLAEMVESGKPLSELAGVFTPYPQVLRNVRVDRKPPLDSILGLSQRIHAIQAELGSEGRVLVRYSGTEPEARIMIEGPHDDQIRRYAEQLSDIISSCCNNNPT